MSDEETLKKVMALLSRASPNYEFIGVQQSAQMATFKTRKGKAKTKSFHYRVFEDMEDDSKITVEVFIGPGKSTVIESE